MKYLRFTKKSKYVVLGLLTVLLIGVCIYLENQSNNTGMAPSTFNADDNLNIPPPPSEPVPIGNSSNGSSTIATCVTKECLYQNFSSCNPSSAEFGLGDVSTTQLEVYYQILGLVPGGCKMSYRYTQNPNPDWINKDITCVYDNKLDFQQALTEEMNEVTLGTSDCSGPLMDVIPKNN